MITLNDFETFSEIKKMVSTSHRIVAELGGYDQLRGDRRWSLVHRADVCNCADDHDASDHDDRVDGDHYYKVMTNMTMMKVSHVNSKQGEGLPRQSRNHSCSNSPLYKNSLK